MAEHVVTFDDSQEPIQVVTGTLVSDAARAAGIHINQPCGGQGRCGRCAVIVKNGHVRRRSTLRLQESDIEAGYALSCQTVIEGDAEIAVPSQDAIKQSLITNRVASEVKIPETLSPSLVRVALSLRPPEMGDQTDDWSRLCTAIRQQTGYDDIQPMLAQLQRLGTLLRDSEWDVTVILDTSQSTVHLVDIIAGHVEDDAPLWAVAIDIGTTTVSLWLVDVKTGQVHTQVSAYNGQIAYGEDVISRIIYTKKNGGGGELQASVVTTINALLIQAIKRKNISHKEIVKAVIAGNSTMIHLLLNIPAESIRLMPFVTAINHIPRLTANDLRLDIHPEAIIDCLPGVASYVGADITSGVLSSKITESDRLSLFIDVGTNGEIVLGNEDFLVTCACSAGPAFEGGGVHDGIRATDGAIEEIWIDNATFEPTYRVIGTEKPIGICGSGLIALLAEMMLTGLIDKGGSINTRLDTPRIRTGQQGAEYVVVWADESANGKDIVINNVDIDNLLRAKAAIYAGFTVLAEQVGIPLNTVEQVIVGGSFGKYINVEKAIEIGLLPDMPWEQFDFLGNTSVRGAYLALVSQQMRNEIRSIAGRMTYIELSADNTFYEAFTSALFLPHTDLSHFPTVQEKMAI